MKTNGPNYLVGIDIGGTYFRSGIAGRRGGQIVRRLKGRTRGLTEARFCRMLEDLIGRRRRDIAAVGIAVPGFCDRSQKTVVTTCHVVPFLESCELAAAIEGRLCIPAWVDNDARAHALGEYDYGGWGKPRSLAVLTLGTGVGLSWLVDGNLYPPPDHGAMAGHSVVAYASGNPCYCGGCGCIESLASGTAVAAAANECLSRFVPSQLSYPATSELICRLGRSDAVAKDCLRRAAQALKAALHNLHHFYFPNLVVLGGGLAPGLWPYLSEVKRYFEGLPRYDGRKNRLVLSRLGDQAGILGAAAVAAALLKSIESS